MLSVSCITITSQGFTSHVFVVVSCKLANIKVMMQAFMGEVAMWTGVVTGSLMFASPILFDRLGWRGVAGATPTFMLFAGMPFFAGVSIYAFMSLNAVAPPAPVVLKALVAVGAIIQVLAVNFYCQQCLMRNTVQCKSDTAHNML